MYPDARSAAGAKLAPYPDVRPAAKAKLAPYPDVQPAGGAKLAPAVPGSRPLFGKRILEERLPATQSRDVVDDWFVLLDVERTGAGILACVSLSFALFSLPAEMRALAYAFSAWRKNMLILNSHDSSGEDRLTSPCP